MSGPVTYRHDDSIAVITLDDGKANAISHDTLLHNLRTGEILPAARIVRCGFHEYG